MGTSNGLDLISILVRVDFYLFGFDLILLAHGAHNVFYILLCNNVLENEKLNF